MNTSDAGIQFIKAHEGVRLTAYRDSIGVLTVGVGHTGPDVYPNQTITDDEATELLRKDLNEAEAAVDRLVTADLDQNQFDALVSFVFNCGEGNFSKSTLLRKTNAGDFDAAAQEFQKWDMAGGKPLAGLLKRRLAEAALYEGTYLA